MRPMITRGCAPEALIDVSTVLRYGFGDIVQPLVATLDGELWKQVGHDNMASLVYSRMPEGWEVTREILMHFLASSPLMCQRLKDAMPDSDVRPFEVGAVPAARKNGGDRRSETAADQLINSQLKDQSSTGSARTIARLKRDHPELMPAVESGELSPNAAAIKAGIRTRTITIPCEPKRAAAALRRQFKGEDFQRLLNEMNAEAIA